MQDRNIVRVYLLQATIKSGDRSRLDSYETQRSAKAIVYLTKARQRAIVGERRPKLIGNWL